MIHDPNDFKRFLRAALAVAVLTCAFTARAAAAPQITALGDTTLARSGRLLIFGTDFGATQPETIVAIYTVKEGLISSIYLVEASD